MNLTGFGERRGTSSRTGGRITKWKGKAASLAPSIFAFSVSSTALMVGGALAQTINTPTTTPVVSTTDTDLTITSAGSVTVDPLTGAAVVEINLADYTSTLTNAGTVSSSSGSSAPHVGIDINGALSGSISNIGTVDLTYTDATDTPLTGIDVSGAISGAIANMGAVNVITRSTRLVRAKGINTDDLSGQITNSNTLNVIAVGSNARATGVRVQNIASTGNLSNTGTVTAIADASSSTGFAFGLRFASLAGTVINSGTLDIQVSGVSHASAYGIGSFTSNPVGGTLTNSGQITVNAISNRSFADGYGIHLPNLASTSKVRNTGVVTVNVLGTRRAEAYGLDVNDVDGQLSNSGAIDVMATAAAGGATATGLSSAQIATGARVSNSGSISAVAHASSTAEANALTARDVTGTLVNSGTLSAIANGSLALAAGLNVNDINGQFSNSGSISATANGTTATATGLRIAQSIGLSGTLTNSGTIVALVSGDTSAFATGVDVIRVDGRFANSGNIFAATVSNGGSTASAVGIDAGFLSNSAAELSNAGTINVSLKAAGVSFATATGIRTGTNNGRLSNAGTINVVAEKSGGSAPIAVGLDVFNLQVGGNVSNSGTINVAAVGKGGAGADAYGISVFLVDAGATVTHSGVLNVSAASDGSSAFADGIRIRELNGTLNVTGDISVSAPDQSYGISLSRGNGTLNIESTASIDQLIRVADHNVNLTHVGEAAVYRFEDANTAAGEFKTNVTVPNGAWFAQDAGGASPVYAAVSGSDFQLNTLVPFLIGDLNNQLSRQLQNSDRQNRFDRAAYAFNGTPEATSTFSPYVSVTLSQARQDSTADAASADSNLNSLNFGVTRDLGNGTRYGVGLSYAKGTASQSPNSLDTTGGFLSAQIAQDFGFLDLSAGGGAGWFSHTNYRTIGGSADAKGDFTSTVLTGQIGVSRDFGLTDTLILTPEALARLGYQQYGGYTETGSSANATVDGRNVTFSEINVGATVAAKLGPGILTASAAAVYRNVDGPSVVDVSIFGSGASLTSDVARTDTFGELRLGYDQPVGSNGTLSLQGQTGIGQDSMTQAVSAVYKLTF
ncbi:autotransporter outer membrane beta-barrel domain-containing protein [Roseibium sp. SCP14]|uniref:autotransporter outer membrane beta-barrel domain-containing protein n=1 Tax=Roseibium sp. SCP14 TaxID=3141375 RepID=UPI00333A4995